jgi:thiosulfate/3-mercaptopyruvate sulfurtransferase
MFKSGWEVFMWKSLLFAAAIAAATVTCAQAATPRDQLLVTPAWLSEHATDKDLVILHIGTPAGYQAKHIPGAHLVDPNGLTVKSPEGLITELPSPEELRAQMQALGISDRSRIVVYSENDGIARATRIILTLDAAGFGNRASLLDGGLKGWESSGHAATAEAAPATNVVLSPLKMQSRIVTADYVQSHLKSPGFTIVDARAPEFYNGEKPGIEGAVPGHIPGAHNIPFTTVSDADGKLRSPEELKAMFIAAGVKPGDHVIAYCHIGIQATAVIFAARTMGIDAQLYDGSFQDWSKRGLPVEMPAAAGK